MGQKTPSPEIPDKLYFKIGEVSSITDLPPYVLRFWESEFPSIRPKRSGSGQRLYKKKDIEMIFQIKHLLHHEKFTVKGARRHLSQTQKKKGPTASAVSLDEIRTELKNIRDMLS